MAISESIRSDLDAVFDARTETECFYKTLELLSPDHVVVHALRLQVERWGTYLNTRVFGRYRRA